MNNSHINKQTLALLAQHAITLTITHKKVKNINFRIKPNHLNISAPHYAGDNDIANAIDNRLTWIINAHTQLLRQQHNSLKHHKPSDELPPFRLWGVVQPIHLSQAQRLHRYRSELQQVMPALFARWQPIVGACANEYRIKKMTTRWGSCNTTAKRIWLSLYLPEYPIECTEYVIVHELCHLHHADHSAKFWAAVERAMPHYKHWHDMLRGKHGMNIDDQ